jgi:hypothetical protein
MPGVLSPDIYLRGDNGAMRQTDGTTDAPVNGWLGGVVYNTVAASSALTGSSTETAMAAYTIPASTLVAGSIIKVRYQGIATATNSSDTLTVKLYLGGLSGTAILTGTATDVADNNIFAGEALLQVRTVGATGTFVAVGTHTDVPAASGTATHGITEITASTTIDTTATLAVTLSCKWSTTSGSNSCRVDIFVVEMY